MVESGPRARDALQDWFRALILGSNFEEPKALVGRSVATPPEVFLSMPFQGFLQDPSPFFDFALFQQAVEGAAQSMSMSPKPKVTQVGLNAMGGDLFDSIIMRMAAASVVVADLSPDHRSEGEPNANVITEATIARAGFGHGKTLILCAQAGTRLPRSWSTFRTIYYDPRKMTCLDDDEPLVQGLARRMASALGTTVLPPQQRPAGSAPPRLQASHVPAASQRMVRDVFISYSSKDAEIAGTICSLLEKRGVSCWIAPRDVPPGTAYDEEIIAGIENTRATVVVLSEHSNESGHVKRELEITIAEAHAILPIRIQNILPGRNLKYYVAGKQWVDAWQPPIEGAIDDVATAIKGRR
jgi:hypothetical protein